MKAFRKHTGLAVPLERANVDTDQIIPKQFLKRIERTGFGQYLFNDWRRNSSGEENREFVLNQPRYRGASILIAAKNFGCGSSREHAVWSLADFGFRAVIAPSFADIFANNSAKNGLLTIALPESQVHQLLRHATEIEGYQLTVDLEQQKITDGNSFEAEFRTDDFVRRCLLEGLDDIGLTLQHESDITVYETRHPLPSSMRAVLNS